MAEEFKTMPVGIQSLEDIVRRDCLYVDKTQYIYDIVCRKKLKYVFLSRPRRFGKSLLIDTFAKYFEGRKDLFNGLYLGEKETEWTVHPVIRLDMSECKREDVEGLRAQVSLLLTPYETKYLGRTFEGGDLGGRLKRIIVEAEAQTGQKVVLLIDEYDAPLMNVLEDGNTFNILRKELRTLYAPIKYCDEYLHFGMITGITKFSQLSIFSEINNLYNISMGRDYSGICGITEGELDGVVGKYVEKLAKDLGKSKEETREDLLRMYDGYRFCYDGERMLNPFSLISAFVDNMLSEHWFTSATPRWLIDCLKNADIDMDELESAMCMLEEFDVPTESVENVWPLLYQTGYVTIKDYDAENKRYTLGYPNQEVKHGMLMKMLPYYVGAKRPLTQVEVLRDCFQNGEVMEALHRLRSLFASMPYNITSKTERHFQAMFYLIFKLLVNAKTESEVKSARGRADAVVKTKDYIYVFEFKLDKTADKALAQIEKKGYAVPYETDGRKVIKIGANFDSGRRTLNEWVVDDGEKVVRWNEGKGDDEDD